MKRRSFLSALAALPFLPKLFGKQKEALTAAKPRQSEADAYLDFIEGCSDPKRYTSGTYSDAVTYRADFAPPVFVNEIPEGIYYTDPDGFRRYAGGSWTQGDAPAPSEPLG